MFFSSLIHATDSTQTGCKANRNAATHSQGRAGPPCPPVGGPGGLRRQAQRSRPTSVILARIEGRRPQPPQNEREQQSRGCVQQDICEMIAENGVAPKTMLDPERAMQDGIILLHRPDFEPDPPQAMPGAQGASGDIIAVVPKEAAVQAWPIGNQCDAIEQHRQPAMSSCHAFPGGNPIRYGPIDGRSSRAEV